MLRCRVEMFIYIRRARDEGEREIGNLNPLYLIHAHAHTPTRRTSNPHDTHNPQPTTHNKSPSKVAPPPPPGRDLHWRPPLYFFDL